MLPKSRLQPDPSAAGFAHHASASGNLTMPAQPEPRRRGSLQHNKLLAEKRHLGFASRMRSEHSDEQSAEQPQEVDHPGDESSPSRQLRQPGCDFR
jgi:hypothetical protein